MFRSALSLRRHLRVQNAGTGNSWLDVDLQFQDLKPEDAQRSSYAVISTHPRGGQGEWMSLSDLTPEALRVAGGVLQQLEYLTSDVLHIFTPAQLAYQALMLDEQFRDVYYDALRQALPQEEPITWTHVQEVERQGVTPITSLHLAPFLQPAHQEAIPFAVLQRQPEDFSRVMPRLPHMLRTLDELQLLKRRLAPRYSVGHYRDALEEHGEINHWREPFCLFTLDVVDNYVYDVVNESYQHAMQYGTNLPNVVYHGSEEAEKLDVWERLSRRVAQLSCRVVQDLQAKGEVA